MIARLATMTVLLVTGLAASAAAEHQQKPAEQGDRYVLVVPPHSVGPAVSLNLLGLIDLRVQTWSYATPGVWRHRGDDCYSYPRSQSGYGRYYYFSPGGIYGGSGGYGYRGSAAYGAYGGSYSQQPGGRLWQNWAPRGDGSYSVTHHYSSER